MGTNGRISESILMEMKKKLKQTIEGTWKMICNGEIINQNGIETIKNQSITIPGRSAVILYQE